MTGNYEKRLSDLGLELPEAAVPIANYVPYATSGALVYISGQLPLRGGKLLFTGKVGDTVSIDEAAAAARQSALNIISLLKLACEGDLDRMKGVVRLGGFVAAGSNFTDHSKVINGASDLMVEVFCAAGRHARAAVGCPSLPLDAPVEVDAIIEIT